MSNEDIRAEAGRHLEAHRLRHTVDGVDTLAQMHGLEPFAGTKGNEGGVWGCWADRVLSVATCAARYGEEELAQRVAEANTYSGQAALRAIREREAQAQAA